MDIVRPVHAHYTRLTFSNPFHTNSKPRIDSTVYDPLAHLLKDVPDMSHYMGSALQNSKKILALVVCLQSRCL
ncbi:BnaC07g17000D [Brassica napus]|uniref:(rape) hypothetical protein n=1 Tax=Brassica napus TaxID=3708 RepID=A0A078IEM2_BRANA|nr:unnamed protein product [Brassica napus]CDY47809.1 BnaC07g17000D [Brassica napus]